MISTIKLLIVSLCVMLFCALAVPYTMADEWNQATKASSSAVHGVKSSAEAGKDTWHGLTEGTEVVAHYTKRGTQDTVLEIDKLGHDGLKTSEGTTEDFDRNGKKLVVKAENGVDSFRLTDHAAKDAGRDIAKRTKKGTKVTVYYTEDAGDKVAHFFEGS